MEQALSKNVHNDLNWIESELAEALSDGREWLVGNDVTAADVMMGFSIQFIFVRKLGIEGSGKWPNVEKWLGRVQGRHTYKHAVVRTGYSL